MKDDSDYIRLDKTIELKEIEAHVSMTKSLDEAASINEDVFVKMEIGYLMQKLMH